MSFTVTLHPSLDIAPFEIDADTYSPEGDLVTFRLDRKAIASVALRDLVSIVRNDAEPTPESMLEKNRRALDEERAAPPITDRATPASIVRSRAHIETVQHVQPGR